MRADLRSYLIVTALYAAVTVPMVTVRVSLNLATVTLSYLLLVFLSAVWWGRGPSVMASVLSFLGSNYFFTVPYGTFRVDSTQDVISLGVFLVVAEMTTRLVTQAREREAEARQQAREASTLYALVHDMSVSKTPEAMLDGVPSRIVERLGVRRCSIFLPDTVGGLRLYTSEPGDSSQDPVVPQAAVQAFTTLELVENDGNIFLPLTVGERALGVLHVESSSPQTRVPEATRRLLQTFATQAAVIIERLRLYQEATEAEMLRKADELKSAMLSTVSHDLRTPLASIRIAATGLLQRDFRSDEDARRELLEMIDTEAARLARLVNNLLDLSRIDAGVLKPDKEWRELQEVIARAVDHMHNRLRTHRMVVSLPDDLPLVPLDFTEIEDVLVNLLDNAVRHSSEGTTIEITAEQRNHEVVVQVENEGPSIPPEAARQIFDRFYRVQRDRRGLGLGLAICKGLVEAHGGRIWVDRPGQPGARFAFALPLDATPAARPPQR